MWHRRNSPYSELAVTERLEDGQHFLVSDETPAMSQLVLIDRFSQFSGIRRESLVAVAELSTLDTRGAPRGIIVAPIDERLCGGHGWLRHRIPFATNGKPQVSVENVLDSLKDHANVERNFGPVKCLPAI